MPHLIQPLSRGSGVPRFLSDSHPPPEAEVRTCTVADLPPVERARYQPLRPTRADLQTAAERGLTAEEVAAEHGVAVSRVAALQRHFRTQALRRAVAGRAEQAQASEAAESPEGEAPAPVEVDLGRAGQATIPPVAESTALAPESTVKAARAPRGSLTRERFLAVLAEAPAMNADRLAAALGTTAGGMYAAAAKNGGLQALRAEAYRLAEEQRRAAAKEEAPIEARSESEPSPPGPLSLALVDKLQECQQEQIQQEAGPPSLDAAADEAEQKARSAIAEFRRSMAAIGQPPPAPESYRLPRQCIRLADLARKATALAALLGDDAEVEVEIVYGDLAPGGP